MSLDIDKAWIVFGAYRADNHLLIDPTATNTGELRGNLVALTFIAEKADKALAGLVTRLCLVSTIG
ncbi:hypothetical protein [Pseudomonas sp. ICMP 460]|uniref:hypothetical protein n=1 Tax=Pseudomonas sp. ICMP 460 TaxID=1718917 RepID=UPI000C0B7350|nr:hypothetical protein [Pseudomonas sp. ICMP 460]PHN31791.1 hypothetical protein AO240_16035 [Pseudomonas sp. ICMP 460]